MIGQEVGTKLVRLLSFVGAGVICAAAINQWERKLAQNSSPAPETSNPKLGQTVKTIVHCLF